MEIVVREFVEEDRQELRELYVASRNAAFTWASATEHTREDFDISTQGERILVAAARGTLAGFASVWEPDSFLHNLFVHPTFFRRGVGQALLRACEKYFADAPSLKCLQSNEAALRFYLAQGWCVRHASDGPDGPYFLLVKSDSSSL